MIFRKHVQLNDGTFILLEQLGRNEDVHEFRRFINSFVKENVYLLLDQPVTIQEEKNWLKNQIAASRKGEQIYLKALMNTQLIGLCHTQRGIYRNRGNVMMGIAVEKHWRRKGLGRLMLKEMILLAQQRWDPKNIYLHVVSANQKARGLYESLGFRIIGRLPHWFEYHGKYYDELILLLK